MDIKDKIFEIKKVTPVYGATEGEILNIIEEINNLLVKYYISEKELRQIEFSKDMKIDTVDDHKKTIDVAAKLCAETIGEFCDVKAWHCNDDGKRITRFFGLKSDVETAKVLYDFVRESMIKGWKNCLANLDPKINKRKPYWDYHDPFANKINEKFRNLVRARNIKESGIDLVVLKHQYIEETFSKMGGRNIRPANNVSKKSDGTDDMEGVVDKEDGQETMASEPPFKMPPAVNLILYGPPGTGKTYATAWEAVRLCVGGDMAAPLRNDRAALMAEYRRLAHEGRIEFVTFHQSFSYEDFVEGLRPTTETESATDEQDDAVASGGFSLKPQAGVFKVISEKARLDTGNAPTKRLDRSRRLYKIALGRRGSEEDRICEALDQSLIHIGWGGDIDWSDDRFDDFEEIRKEWNAKKDPDANGKDPNIEMTFAFRSGLQIGDYVVISDGRDSYRAFGKVTGDYEFDPTTSFHPHKRRVEWLWRDDNGAERAAFYPNNFRQQAAYRLTPGLVDWDALETVVMMDPNAELPVPGARPHVLIIDEINRANISKVFGELITLLEADKRLGCENEVRVRLPYSGTRFGVPSNLHIIGTMNTADRSIALLDTALRRRFTFRELMPDISELRKAMDARELDVENLGGINLSKLLTTINERIEYLFDREHQIGHAYFTECRDRADVEDVMRHKIIPLLAEYFYEDWSKVAAVLGDRAGGADTHFLEAKRLSPPVGLGDDEHDGEKLRWSVKAEFDFSEFEA